MNLLDIEQIYELCQTNFLQTTCPQMYISTASTISFSPWSEKEQFSVPNR